MSDVAPVNLVKLALSCFLASSLTVSGQTQRDPTQGSGSSPSGGAYGGYGAGPGIPGGAGGGHGGANVPYGGGSSRGPGAGGQGRTSPSNPGTRQPPTRERSRTTNPPDRDTYNNSGRSRTSDRMRQMRSPIYLQGRVATNVGEVPPERVVVKISCGATSIPQDYTDKKGRFSFQPFSNRSVMFTDASVSRMGRPGRPTGLTVGTSGGANLSHCHLEAELPGYRSNRLSLGMLRMGANDVGLIVLHRLEGLVGYTVSVTTLNAPASAQKAYQKGIKALRKMRPNREAAVQHLERAVQIYPEYAAAWAALGEAHRGLADEDEARTAYTRSMEADPEFLLPYEPLIDLAINRTDWSEVGSLTERYLKLSPRSSRVRFLAALAAANQNDLPRAESLLESMGQLNETDEWPLTHVIMAVIHEGRAEWAQAAGEYRAYIRLGPDQKTLEMAKRRLYEWEMLGIIEPEETIVAGARQP